ncbi:MAG: DAK2 domain-containing protein [Vulcanimicrobiaceae bacterium]
MDLTALDGRGFQKFVVAGTYFLRKYRGVLDELNVFPVPDGDTGSNMYFTARSALAELGKVRGKPLAAVAAAAAHGSLLGARGNSGVILSQMLRGFAHNVRHRPTVDSLDLALAMREGVAAARAALVKPVEGTIISVATAAADAAYTLSQRETDLYRVATGIVRAAADALERTPEQLPVLKEAGVVDSGGAGLVYFLEGILRFLPETQTRATAFPRRPPRRRAFTPQQVVGTYHFCTELILEDTPLEPHALRELLAAKGDSLLVIGSSPVLKVHIHTDDPGGVLAIAAEHGTLTREKVDDMARQHQLLVVDRPQKAFSIVAVVPGEGFAQIARELGAEGTILAYEHNPSVGELVLGVNAGLADEVYLLANDPNVAMAAYEAAKLADRTVVVVPTRDVPGGFAVLLELGARASEPPPLEALLENAGRTRVGEAFFAGKDSYLGGVFVKYASPVGSVDGRLLEAATLGEAVERSARELGAEAGGLLTLYYGGAQKERDARQISAKLAAAFGGLDVEYYYGGQRATEYVISLER